MVWICRRLILRLLTLTLEVLEFFVELLRSFGRILICLIGVSLSLRSVLVGRHLLLRLSSVLAFGLDGSRRRWWLFGLFVALGYFIFI